jgi:hypothetical protein
LMGEARQRSSMRRFKTPRDTPVMSRERVWVVAMSLAVLALATAARGDDARTARLRLLCAQISGDLTEPGGIAEFRRCLNARDPVAAMRQNALPPRRPMPQLVAHTGVALTANASGHQGAAGCGGRLVWRGATAGDRHCVTPQFHAATTFDNAHAGTRVAGPNGACKTGYVWREATAADHVCVTPATRALVRSQNG